MHRVILLLSVGILGAPSCGLDAKPEQEQATLTALPPRVKMKSESAPGGLAPGGSAHGENDSPYIRQINSLMGTRWAYALRQPGASFIKPETAEYSILLNAQGRLVSLRLISEQATPAYAAICENAINEAAKEFPPVPPELLDAKSRTLRVPIIFRLYEPRF